MAIAPDQSDTFAREVDENLRRDQLRDAARAYGKWIIAGVVLFLIAVAAYLYWRDREDKRAADESIALSQAIDNISTGNTAPVEGQLKALEEAHSDAVRVSARLTQAALYLQQSDRPKAIAIYKDIAADDGVAQPWRDLATIRQTALEFDTLSPNAVISRLQPLAQAGNPWFGSAGEMTALAMLKSGRKREAGQLFAAIARDNSVPETIRGRAVQIAGTLGVDASAALVQTTTVPAQ